MSLHYLVKLKKGVLDKWQCSAVNAFLKFEMECRLLNVRKTEETLKIEKFEQKMPHMN